MRIVRHAFQVARELLDPIDLAAPLDLDSDGLAVGVSTEQVDGADVGRMLAGPVSVHLE